MTLAVYDPSLNHVSVDSLLTWSDGTTQRCSKVYRYSKVAYMYAGTLEGQVLMSKAVQVIESTREGNRYMVLSEAEATALRESEGFLRYDHETGSAYYYVCVHQCYLLVDPCYASGPVMAIGSGASQFRALYGSGMSVEEAFHQAVLGCITCGGETEIF